MRAANSYYNLIKFFSNSRKSRRLDERNVSLFLFRKEAENMRKIFVMMTFLVVLSISMVCSAAIADSDLLLGGVKVWDSQSSVKAIHGQPLDEEQFMLNNALDESDLPDNIYGGQVWYYGKQTCIMFDTKKKVGSISTYDAKDGFATPRGIKVGMSMDDVRSAYGEPDSSSPVGIMEMTESGPLSLTGTDITYYNKTGCLNFTIVDNKVFKIACNHYLPYQPGK